MLNDHIMMISRNGAQKAVPIWQINQWITVGRFSLKGGKVNLGPEGIGYAFADEESSQKDYQAWIDNEARKKAKAKFSAGVPRPAEDGIAGAHLKPAGEPSIFSPGPPIPEPGDETKAASPAPQRGVPKDVI